MKLRDNIPTVLITRNNLVREGLRRILEEYAFEVIEAFDSSTSLLDQFQGNISPQLVVMDDGGSDVLQADIEDLHGLLPGARIVVLADKFCFDAMVAAFQAGVDGYVVKEIDCEPLLQSLRLVALGEKVMPSELARQLPGRIYAKPIQAVQSTGLSEILSEREIETLRCLQMGYANKVIAHRLDISEATVKVHVKAILRKLRVQNRTQAAIWAVNNGIEFNTHEASEPVAAEARVAANSSQWTSAPLSAVG